jgi:hypothetical protein
VHESVFVSVCVCVIERDQEQQELSTATMSRERERSDQGRRTVNIFRLIFHFLCILNVMHSLLSPNYLIPIFKIQTLSVILLKTDLYC